MAFEITLDNTPYLNSRGKTVLNACPGSGKTTAIAHKLGQLISECNQEFGKYSGIACLSFTNVAKEEISQKYNSINIERLSYPHLVSTIDSFINQYITLPFYHLLGFKCKRPIIMEQVKFLDETWLARLKNKDGVFLLYSYKPSLLSIEIDNTYKWKGHFPDVKNVEPAVFNIYAKTYKKWQFENGYLNNDDSSYIAFKLLRKFPHIAASLVGRFPYIIIDEAQDTSETQHNIFDLLIQAGLKNIEFIGDPYQSLYEFREARPDLFISRFNDKVNWQGLTFADCRRSTQHIIDCYSLFRNASDPLIKSTSKYTSNWVPKIIKYDEANIPDLLAKYEIHTDPAHENHILVRGQTHLEMLGAKSNSEQPWKNMAMPDLIKAAFHFESGNHRDCMTLLRKAWVQINEPGLGYLEQRDRIETMKTDIDMNIRLFDFVRNIPSMNDTIENWTNNINAYISTSTGSAFDSELKQKKGKPYYQQNVRSLFIKPAKTNFPVSTIHKVKGKTFSSILLVLSANSKANNISLNDFEKPIGYPTEKQRMIYVALSRAEVSVCIAVPSTIPNEDIYAKLGTQIEIF